MRRRASWILASLIAVILNASVLTPATPAHAASWTTMKYWAFNQVPPEWSSSPGRDPNKIQVKNGVLHVKPRGQISALPSAGSAGFPMGTAPNQLWRMDAKIKMPKARPMYASFWMRGTGLPNTNGTTNPGEFDVIESYGPGKYNRCKRGASNYSRYWQYNPSAGETPCISWPAGVSLPWEDYHTYTAMWSIGNNINFYVDNILIGGFTAGPTQTEYMFFSNKILPGDSDTPWTGSGDKRDMLVKWASVSQYQ